MTRASRQNQKQHFTIAGFTIVELLVVIVIIGILVAVSVIAYNGVSKRARDTSVQSTLTDYADKLEIYRFGGKNTAANYPADLSGLGASESGSVTLDYKVINSAPFYCLNGQTGTSKFFVSSLSKNVIAGECPSLTGLVGWWPLNNSEKNIAIAGENAIAVGVTSVDGQNGQASGAYAFTGDAATSYIDTQHISSRTNFTMSVWVYPTTSAGYRTPVSEVRDCCGTGYRGAEIKSSYNAGVGSVSVWSGGSGAVKGANGPGVIPLNAWTLLTATYDGATLSFYQNGTLAQAAALTGDLGTPTNTLKIGKAGAVNAGGFAGRIDDVRVYTRALTAAEVQNMYQSGAL